MRKNYGYEGSEQYRPISPWGYIGYALLFLVPVLGLLLLIVFTFSKKNINRRNFARSYWCGLLLGVVVVFVVAMLSTAGVIPNNWDWLENLGSALPTSSIAISSLNSKNSAVDLSKIPSGVSPEFYETMMSYEEFFDKYVEFMKKYGTSNNDATMLLDYTNFLTQYADAMQKLEEIETSKLTKEEDAYFTEVMLRINRKLNEAF